MKKKIIFFTTILIFMFFITKDFVYASTLNNKLVTNDYYQATVIADVYADNTEESIDSGETGNEENMVLDAASGECSSILSQELLDFINEIFNYIKILVPLYLIVIGSLDLGKSVVAADDKEIKLAQVNLMKRAIAGIAIYFLPAVLNIVLKLAGFAEGTCGIQ